MSPQLVLFGMGAVVLVVYILTKNGNGKRKARKRSR